MKLSEEVFNKWQESLEKIRIDLQRIINDQAIYLGFQDTCKKNRDWILKHQGGTFCDFVRRSYVTHAIAGIRRHLKSDQQSLSLRKFLQQLSTCAKQFTYDFYLKRFPKDEEFEWQKSVFGGISSDGQVVDESKVRQDAEKIISINSEIEKYADRVLFHLDKKGFQGNSICYNDLKKSIDYYNELACKYICIFTGRSFFSLEAVFKDDWQEVFRFPLSQEGV